MHLYIAFVAALNLCVGYVLGAHFRVLPELRIPSVRLRKREEGASSDEPLVQPVAPTTPEAGAGLTNEDIESGLAAFQHQLAEMGKRLEESQSDAQAFGACAKDMQDANHAYLENTQKQIDGMAPEDERRKAVESGAEEVGKISAEFDSIVEQGLDKEETRASLIEKTSELNEKVAEVKQEVADAVAEQPAAANDIQAPDRTAPEVQPAAPTESPVGVGEAVLATLDHLLEQVDGALEADDTTRCRVAALILTDPLASGDNPVPDWFTSVQGRIPELIGQSLNAPNLVEVSDDTQCVALLDERDLDSVFKQVETLRSEIAKTTFTKGVEKLNTTVTCVVVDLPGTETSEEVVRRFGEAAEEARRQGRNKTYHHDGMFPTEVQTEIEAVEPRVVKV
ncbi:MAG: hypothetical protein KDA37_04790 [Planctomycetales bacterium]|nr:hypothetical protein [Planctomycetales bacterium]